MFKLWKILKTAWYLVNNYHEDILKIKANLENHSAILHQHETVILDARNEIIERTTVNADVHVKENSAQIVVIGRYRNADYVNIFSVRNSELNHLIERLKGMEQSMLGRMRHVDAVPNFKSVIFREDR